MSNYTYWVYYKMFGGASKGEGTRAMRMNKPIETESDIAFLQDEIAKDIPGKCVQIISWQELTGERKI